MKYPITLDALEVLDAIARKGSFAAAAQDLFRVPSAISYTVQKMEQDLDVVLFRKEGRKAVLTEAGKVLLEQGRAILEATERLAVAAKTTHSGWEPVFNIAVDSILSFDVVYPLIAQFYEVQPDIEINLYEEVLGGAIEAITTGRADLVIGVGEQPMQHPDLAIRTLRHIEWLFVVAPGHPLAQMPQPLSRQLVEQHRFVVVRDSSRYQAPQSRRLCSKRPVLSVPTINEKIRAQCAGLGVGFLPAHRIQDELGQGRLLPLELEGSVPPEAINAGWKKSNRGKVLHWFIKELLQPQPIGH
ncbi:LysR substrate-binding domain-containing protein [Methylovulum miyakonense]|uniref:LysR substrate-binding domain-containing protein n=1 Tax=Methylovulum miyakonense TaxID=645578 RepID=UPI00035D92F9|nr:LysR substrate-binding domain-containing protein [Methylovulum miyakonense]